MMRLGASRVTGRQFGTACAGQRAPAPPWSRTPHPATPHACNGLRGIPRFPAHVAIPPRGDLFNQPIFSAEWTAHYSTVPGQGVSVWGRPASDPTSIRP